MQVSAAGKVVVVCYGLALALVFLRVPLTQELGYSWLGSMPPAKAWNKRVEYMRIDYQRIVLELAALTAVAGTGLALVVKARAS